MALSPCCVEASVESEGNLEHIEGQIAEWLLGLARPLKPCDRAADRQRA